MSENTDPLITYRARLSELCAKRDATNEDIKPLQSQLDEANARAQDAKNAADALAAQIQERRGGAAWLQLKREIRLLSQITSGK